MIEICLFRCNAYQFDYDFIANTKDTNRMLFFRWKSSEISRHCTQISWNMGEIECICLYLSYKIGCNSI